MLHVKDVGSLITGTKHLTILAKYQEKIITDYLQNYQDLKKAETNLKLKKQEISQLLTKASKKNKEFEREERKYKSLISQIQKNKKVHLQTLKELQERNEQLKILIKKLEKKPLTISIIPLYEKKGRLPWPIMGKIVSRFGKQRHPRFNTVTINNGIEIAPKSDTIVRSIHPGFVVFADYFPGYGNLLIIDHGLSYVSLYGHCSKFLCQKGDIIQAGGYIAEVGDISSLEGVTLYFEIRFKRDALNPLKWLKK
jgi:septal ring factor EnvC (AmiA/AmiB activator)